MDFLMSVVIIDCFAMDSMLLSRTSAVKDFLMHRVECGMQRSQLLKEMVLRCCWREVVD